TRSTASSRPSTPSRRWRTLSSPWSRRPTGKGATMNAGAPESAPDRRTDLQSVPQNGRITNPSYRGRLRRVAGLVRKETQQILRDPSSFLIAGVLPLLLLFLFGFGVSLDLRRVPVGAVVEQATPEAVSLLTSFRNSRYFEVRVARHRAEVEGDLVSGRLKGLIVLRNDFSRQLGRGEEAPVQVIVDGSDPNTAGLVQFYAQGVWANWLAQEAISRTSLADRPAGQPLLVTAPRYWFNPDISSQTFLVPGAVAVVLTLIGTLLTALVVAREWERGTLEALLATPVSPGELLAGKLLPYFLLGMAALGLAVAAAVFLFGVP